MTVDPQGILYVTSGTAIRKGQLATAPIITTQPPSLSVTAGTSAVISVSAAGLPDPTFQWCLNGNVIRGANSRSLAIANVQSADAGDYTVVVTNSFGSVISDTATLTVTSAPGQRLSTAPSGGAGGAISQWFVLALLVLAALRPVTGRHPRLSH